MTENSAKLMESKIIICVRMYFGLVISFINAKCSPVDHFAPFNISDSTLLVIDVVIVVIVTCFVFLFFFVHQKPMSTALIYSTLQNTYIAKCSHTYVKLSEDFFLKFVAFF